MPTNADTPAASLVGALGVFSLPDVLRLIADGAHSGEILVVANGLDGRLWLHDGDLTGAAVRGTTTLAQAVFELALLEDGWFYFTTGRAAPEPLAPEAVDDMLAVVLPQVVEWRDLLHRVPLDAMVNLAPSPPHAQVQLSAAEWQVLAAVGGRGTRVIDVVTATGRDQVQTVRTLRAMADAGLVTISGGTPPSRPAGSGTTGSQPSPAVPSTATTTPLPPPPTAAPASLRHDEGAGPTSGPTAANGGSAAADTALVPMAMTGGPAAATGAPSTGPTSAAPPGAAGRATVDPAGSGGGPGPTSGPAAAAPATTGLSAAPSSGAVANRAVASDPPLPPMPAAGPTADGHSSGATDTPAPDLDHAGAIGA